MSLSPQKLREIIVQLLFSFEMGGIDQEELLPVLMNEVKVTRLSLTIAFNTAVQVWQKQKEIDQKIVCVCDSYDITRIGKVEKSVLRLALYEHCFENKLPLEIIISEAIRLTAKFSTKEGALFVHAIIDAVSKSYAALPS